MRQRLLELDIQAFIRAHQNADVADLALKKPPDAGWPWALVLDQIKARQKGARKVPAWLEAEGLLWPPPDVMEQASSSATAAYKAFLLDVNSFADLTGGAGVDTLALAQRAERGLCVERDPDLAATLAHNLPLLARAPVHVVNASAEKFIPAMEPVDLVLLDPQRRTGSRRGLYRLQDCSPNVLDLIEILKGKTRYLLLKTSPMLDIEKTLRDLPRARDVHVVEHRGECKEVLYLLDFEEPQISPRIHAAAIGDQGETLSSLSFAPEEERQGAVRFSDPLDYLFEPGPAFLKSGGYKTLAASHGLFKLAPHTHLYTAASPCPGFPGRSFHVMELLPVDKKALAVALPELRANLSVRNFPLGAEELRKKLALRDGGDDFLFACTLENGRKTIIRARKL